MQSASRSERHDQCYVSSPKVRTFPLGYTAIQTWPFAVRSKRFFGIHGKMGLSRSHILLAPKERMKEYFLLLVYDNFGEFSIGFVMHAQNLNAGLVARARKERVLPGGESAEDLAMSVL